MAETMFKTLAAGYGSAAVLAGTGFAATGGTVVSWLLFLWIAGALLTLLVAALLVDAWAPSADMPSRPIATTRPVRKTDARVSIAR